MSSEDDEGPLSRKLFRMMVVLILTTVLLATRGFGASPQNEFSTTLAQQLAENLPVLLSRAMDSYLGELGAPTLAEVAANDLLANTSEAASANTALVLSAPQTDSVRRNPVSPSAIATAQLPQPTPPTDTRNASNAIPTTAATAGIKPNDGTVIPPADRLVVAATQTPNLAPTDRPTSVATSPVAVKAVRRQPTTTRKSSVRLPTPTLSPRIEIAPTPPPTPQPPAAPSGQTQSSPATSTPDLPERVKATPTPATTSTPEATITAIPEIAATAIETEPTQTPLATLVATATSTALPSSTPAPSDTPQPTATEAATPTLAPTDTQSPPTPSPQPTPPPTAKPEHTREATAAPTAEPTHEPERTKKPPHEATRTPKPNSG